MLCPVCLADCPNGVVYPKHENNLYATCPMSGQWAYQWDEAGTREAVCNRSGGVCEFCSEHMATEMHHRLARSLGGGWSPANIVHICFRCHRRCTSPAGEQRKWAERVGLLLRSGEDPNAIPVIRMQQTWLSDNVAPPIGAQKRGRQGSAKKGKHVNNRGKTDTVQRRGTGTTKGRPAV